MSPTSLHEAHLLKTTEVLRPFMHIRVANPNRFRQDIRCLAATPPSFVGFLAVNKCSVSDCCHLLSCNTRRRCRSLGGVFVANCHTDMALYRSSNRQNLTFLIRGCFASPCGQPIGVRLTPWSFFLVQLPLTESQTETHQLLFTTTDLAFGVATVCWSGHAAVRGTHHLPWTGNELLLSVSWNVILSK
jgi:hypothetical protein